MALIAILFCLAVQRFANIGGWFQPSWFEAYLRYLNSWLSKLDERLIILLVIAPVLLLFVLLHIVFKEHFFGLFDLIMTVLVLFFCIDARDLKTKLTPYFKELEQADLHAAANAVADFTDDAAMGSMADLPRAVSKAILLKSFEQIFAGLFWFIVFGIYGITTYSLVVLLRHTALKVNPDYIELAKVAARFQTILEWLPARLLGFSYALVGNFNKGFYYCSKNLWSGVAEIKRFVVDSGLAALDVSANAAEANQDENLAALDLVNRGLIVWLIGVMLLLVGGFLL